MANTATSESLPPPGYNNIHHYQKVEGMIYYYPKVIIFSLTKPQQKQYLHKIETFNKREYSSHCEISILNASSSLSPYKSRLKCNFSRDVYFNPNQSGLFGRSK